MTTCVLALCVGAIAPLSGGKNSAIEKRAVVGPVWIGTLGLAGDAQGDRRHHGGPHMAVHHYSADHYPYWREQLPEVSRLSDPGAFGENLHATGLTESEVRIGDRFRLGNALLEVSMGRQPCNTLQRHFARPDMVARIIANHRCGWYYRVIEEGDAEAGDPLQLVEPGASGWTIERAFALLFDSASKYSRAEAEELLALPALAPAWRDKLRARMR